ncbi:valyl-tRNA synthetase [Nonlabens xylanidelens]|uniref:Valine--tRNA ligase n=2 Tax=Nonlabens xylanidelens TaxID=191564 RepID=A0A2S6IJJ3_9FLAO|nr:valine--tRNA ligase [Nonlabens xylanidelens]PPK94368.1 valyl-tRNA synthetase [Nonlabens xylanidelens]PQJ18711.1 valine--tRNA ligase [Nonlabens xylanidelens]PQJ21469.1 valine--tRNA ligase [Nonlabens xylanidelens]
MSLASKYDSKTTEEKWYKFWMDNDFFKSVPDERESYTIVIPPPNVTGVLHMGHMLNNTIQDVLIRRARLKGYNACWVPGTDHASIATEAKVVKKLKEQGIDKNDLSREEFLKHAWDWTDEYGGIILEQLKKLGASCDWSRTKFTLDDDMSASVIKVFIDLYNKGLIYRGYRMVNWDPEAKTTLSDEEVIYEERNGHLYHLKYQIKGSEGFVSIATTRPETILGDAAICVHPEDERYTDLIGKTVIVPIVNREIPVIADSYVDMEFGTGALKITPAHDENDKKIGETHNLEVIDIFNADATLNSFGLHYEGKDRFVVRKEISTELEEKGFLIKKEDHIHKVGTSERTKAVIEPRLSDQWFLKMEDLAQPAIKAVKEDIVELLPPKFKSTYFHWMENVRDWNISRQLMWGQRIPAYYFGDGKDDFVVANSIEEAVTLSRKRTNNDNLKAEDLRQENDVLDTWFSSWLWPISVFNGVLEPENEEINYYYPTRDLVTGPDILFFWVARMIVAGYELRDEKPFDKVYLTGLVRDKQRRKMSKSLGNSPDALGLLEQYGADGVRVGLLLSAAAGNDIMFDEDLCQQGKGFVNKMWNAFKLTQMWEVDNSIAQPAHSAQAIAWYRSRFNETLALIEDHYSKYRISDVLMTSYKLIYDDFCGWLLEIIKPEYQKPIDAKTLAEVIELFEDNLRLMHPFTPFITEEIWQTISERKVEDALCINTWPKGGDVDTALLSDFVLVQDVISGIRTVRKEKQIAFKNEIELKTINNENLDTAYNPLIQKMGNVSSVEVITEQLSGAASYRVKSNEYFIPLEGNIDVAAELVKLEGELKRAKGFLIGVQKKLSNERFVSSAPEQVVAIEKKKEADTLAKIETIEASINALK